MKSKSSSQDWEKEFEEKFSAIYQDYRTGVSVMRGMKTFNTTYERACLLEDVKSFISRLLTLKEREVVETELEHLIYVFGVLEPTADSTRFVEYLQKRLSIIKNEK